MRIFFELRLVLLHTDNGGQFKNININNLLNVFSSIPRKGRARSPFIQVQIEICNEKKDGFQFLQKVFERLAILFVFHEKRVYTTI